MRQPLVARGGRKRVRAVDPCYIDIALNNASWTGERWEKGSQHIRSGKATPAMLAGAPTANAHQTLCKSNWTMAIAKQKVLKAQERADKAAEVAAAARKRAYDEMMSTGFTKQVAAPTRTSTKSFAAGDPAHALAALECVDLIRDATTHDFDELGVVAHKYSVRAASLRMTQPAMDVQAPLYPSMRASAMMAAKTVRYIYDVALELAATQPERFAEAQRALGWHSPQQMLKGRQTRGAGIVMCSDATRELVKMALVTAKDRVGKRVAAAAQYKSEMEATVAAAGADSDGVDSI